MVQNKINTLQHVLGRTTVVWIHDMELICKFCVWFMQACRVLRMSYCCYWNLTQRLNSVLVACRCIMLLPHAFILTIVATVTDTKNTLVLNPSLGHRGSYRFKGSADDMYVKYEKCIVLFVSHSTGMIIISSGIHQNIQVCPTWDFLNVTFGSQTFCCITGRYCEDRSAWCCTVIGYAWCQTRRACIVLCTI